MKDSDEVLLLVGAGASQYLGIPAMRGMFDEFVDFARSNNKDDWNVCKLFADDLGVPNDLEEFLLAANAAIEFPNLSLFDLFGKVVSPRAGKSLHTFRSRTRSEISKIKHARQSILTFMAMKCFQFDRTRAAEHLSGLVNVLADKGYPIFTTNYDFSIEHVAEENSVDLNDNFYLQNRRLLWDPSISFSRSAGLTLVKLHGSVTWYFDNNRQIEKLDTPTSINKAGKQVKQLVVFPTRFKDIYEQNLFALYSKFLSALSLAKCLIVVGHSLRDEYIRAAIIERYRKGDFKILVIDPEWPRTLPTDFRPARKGDHGQLTHVPQKFETFSDELANVLSHVAAEAIPRECAGVVNRIARVKDKLRIRGRLYQLRVGTATIELSVDVYIAKDERPATLIAWLEGKAKKPDGRIVTQASPRSLVVSPSPLAFGLTGTFRKDISIDIKVPRYVEWLASGEKIKLKVALIKGTMPSRVSRIKASQVIAQDEREIKYSR